MKYSLYPVKHLSPNNQALLTTKVQVLALQENSSSDNRCFKFSDFKQSGELKWVISGQGEAILFSATGTI